MLNLAAIIVQYNNFNDTIQCVTSLLSSSELPRLLIVVDNCSTNDAFNRVLAEYKPISPQINYMFYSGSPDDCLSSVSSGCSAELPQVFLVKNDVNSGYAGGNNIGLNIGLAGGVDAFWILNNDTIVDPDACNALFERLFTCERPGLAGGLTCYLSNPDMVQCRGGGYTNPWFFLSKLNGHTMRVTEALQASSQEVEKNLNFIYGASVMASREFVVSVGLMDEQLFLYCEEQDWSWAAQGKFDLAYAPKALVYHKEGGSTGMTRYRRPLRRLLLLTRNKLLVTWKHHPVAMPFVCIGIIYSFFRLVFRRFMAMKNAG